MLGWIDAERSPRSLHRLLHRFDIHNDFDRSVIKDDHIITKNLDHRNGSPCDPIGQGQVNSCDPRAAHTTEDALPAVRKPWCAVAPVIHYIR